MQTIVVAIIAITVLLVLITILVKNVKTPANEINKAGTEISLTKCDAPTIHRECLNPQQCTDKKGTHSSFYDSSCPTTNFCCDYS